MAGATKVNRLLRYKTKLDNCTARSDSFARTAPFNSATQASRSVSERTMRQGGVTG
jgi:hypothetical protein